MYLNSGPNMIRWLPVMLHTPAHSQLAGPLTYLSEQALAAGTLVRVPLGQRELLGVVWDAATDPGADSFDAERLRPISAPLEAIAPLSLAWRQLVTFAANYYQRSIGEVALAALPPQLRDLNTLQLARRRFDPTSIFLWITLLIDSFQGLKSLENQGP